MTLACWIWLRKTFADSAVAVAKSDAGWAHWVYGSIKVQLMLTFEVKIQAQANL